MNFLHTLAIDLTLACAICIATPAVFAHSHPIVKPTITVPPISHPIVKPTVVK